MRFSDLKKKFPSLRVGVLVIAAFALLGSMMLPSISEKMGLDEGLCVADEGYDAGEYYSDEMEQISRDYERRMEVLDGYCTETTDNDEDQISCYLVMEAICDFIRLEDEATAEETWLEYPDTPPWERP